MSRTEITLGLHLPPKPPLYALRAAVYAARLQRLESLTFWDHFQDLFPRALWDKELSWLATQSPTPHEFYDFQVLLGNLAARAGRLRLGVGVTAPARRHPVVLAQAMLTLAHMTRRPPILGIGSGERENLEPYGMPTDHPVGRLEEALQVIRMCFNSHGPLEFHGRHFQLDRAFLDLRAPKRRTPEIWIAAHGPRMLQLTGRYGDGWLPVALAKADDYAAKLAIVRNAARQAGRDPDEILPGLQVYTVIAPTEREARAMLSNRAIRFVGVLAPAELWRQFGQRHPFGDDFPGWTEFMAERYDWRTLDEAIAQVPLDALAEALVWGTPDQVAGKLCAFTRAGARHVNIELVSAMVSRRAALYGLRSLGRIARSLRAEQAVLTDA